jgi:hypothetical protein
MIAFMVAVFLIVETPTLPSVHVNLWGILEWDHLSLSLLAFRFFGLWMMVSRCLFSHTLYCLV